jgi:hypothetical protein
LRRQTRALTSEYIVMGQCAGTTTLVMPFIFEPPMRAAPSLSVSNVADFVVSAVAGAVDTTNVAVGGSVSAVSAHVNATVSSGLTSGQAAPLQFDATSGAYIQFSAEL